MITAILDGSISKASFQKENYFGLEIPISLLNVDTEVLNPVTSWSNKDDYHNEAIKLAKQFKDNFKIYGEDVEYLSSSGPII